MNRKHRGGHSELIAAAWLLRQGYEVFRNVSQFGDIDLVAIKDGVATYFDVKTPSLRADGSHCEAKLSPRQISLGVLALHVLPDGECAIGDGQHTALLRAAPDTPKTHEMIECGRCGTAFVRQTKWHRYCSTTCRSQVFRSEDQPSPS